MNAGRILRAAGFDVAAVRAALDPVDPDRVNVWPASPLARRLWREGVEGATHWRWVLVHPRALSGDPQRLARLVIHEMVHLWQFRRLGPARFLTRYLAEYFAGRLRGVAPRQAYLEISAEREARDLTERLTGLR